MSLRVDLSPRRPAQTEAAWEPLWARQSSMSQYPAAKDRAYAGFVEDLKKVAEQVKRVKA